MAIKVIGKQNGVAILLPNEEYYFADPDGDLVAENGSITGHVNIRESLTGRYIAKELYYTSVLDSSGNVIGGSGPNCVSLLNSNYFDRTSKIQEIDNVNFQNTQAAGQALVLTNQGGSLKFSNEPITSSINGATGAITIASGNDNATIDTSGTTVTIEVDPQYIAETVKNVSGVTLAKGTPVKVTGAAGNTPEVIAADAATNYPAHFVLNEDLGDDAEGLAIATGHINSVSVPDASIYAEGQEVFLGSSGGFTTTKPTGTNQIQKLGVILKVNTDNDTISGIIQGAGRVNDVPNIPRGNVWAGNSSGVATATDTAYIDIDNSRVGIGTSTPISSLQVAGAGYFSGETLADVGLDQTYNNVGLIIDEEDYILTKDGGSLRKLIGKTSDVIQIGQTNTSLIDGIALQPGTTDGYVSIYDNTTEYARFQSGKLGIGTTTPSEELHVVGQIKVDDGANPYTLPAADGSANYVLQTNGSGVVSWAQIDYTTDIANTPSIPVSGVDFDPVGTDNSTDLSVNANASDVLRINPGQILGAQDAGADKLAFWDDSASKLTYAAIGDNLTMTGATLSASVSSIPQSFSAPTNVGEFQDGARLIVDAYGTSPSATAGNLVNLAATNVSNVGAQSAAAAATGMLLVVTDAGTGDELLIEGVVKLSTTTTTALLPTTAKKGAPVYMSTTVGAVTTTAPSTAGDFVRVVGYVVDATNRTIYFKPDNTWLEL
jgi:hypothetical protein